MSYSCNDCGGELDIQSQPLYTVCPCCDQLTTFLSQNSEQIQSNLDADDITVSIRRGKFEKVSTVQKSLKQHGERLSVLESLTEEFDNQLARIERLIRLTLSWQCPDCHGELFLDEPGQMRCSECQSTYPQRPTLK